MVTSPDPQRNARSTARLSREAIARAGIAIADAEGLDALSMRRLGQDLRANPMSIYHHLRDKDAVLDAMVDTVIASVDPPPSGPDPSRRGGDWRHELRSLVMAARHELKRHPWVPAVVQQRERPTEVILGHIEQVLTILRDGGCSVELSHHALHLLGSRILGFSQDLFNDSADERAGDPAASGRDGAPDLEGWSVAYPHVVELAAAVTHDGVLAGCDDEHEFTFALDVLLDGIERCRVREAEESSDD
ncbi:MAG: TetR/AcrR family transcriptional regulator [Nocardioides sp.]